MAGRYARPGIKSTIDAEAAFAEEMIVPVHAALDHFGSGYGLLYQFNHFGSVVATLHNSNIFLGLVNLADAIPNGPKEERLEQLLTSAAQLAIIIFGAKNMFVPSSTLG